MRLRIQIDHREIACWNEKAVPFEYDDQGRVVLLPEIPGWGFTVVEITAKRSRAQKARTGIAN
jgi:hypothetical protein